MTTDGQREPIFELEPESERTWHWQLEAADLLAEVDTRLHRVMNAILSATDEFKARVGRETEQLVDEYKRARAELLQQIDLASSELQAIQERSERSARPPTSGEGQDHERLIAGATAEARAILAAAESRSDTLLAGLRDNESQLRALEKQFREALGLADNGPPGEAAPIAEQAERPAPPETRQASDGDHPAIPRPRSTVEIAFTRVLGFQQAAALERAVRELGETDEVDILEFESGHLVLSARVSDPEALSAAILDRAPAPIRLVEFTPDRLAFEVA